MASDPPSPTGPTDSLNLTATGSLTAASSGRSESVPSDDAHRDLQSLRKQLELLERERTLIGNEIHDGLVQQITGGLMLLEAGISRLDRQGVVIPEEIGHAAAAIRESLAEARRLIGGLRPPLLDEYGLGPALARLVESLKIHGRSIEVNCHVEGNERWNAPLELAAYRIVQEALHNILKHSQARHATVSIGRVGPQLHIEVVDDGIGFEMAEPRETQLGLRGIRERASLFGGAVTIESRSGHGTKIVVNIPAS